MRKLTKTAAVVASMAVMAMGTTVMASAAQEGWVQSGANWYYYDNGDRVSNQWVRVDDDWYFLDDEGKMVKNAFVRIDKFSGESEVLDDNDIHDELGTDDIDDDSEFYFMGADGIMVKGWKELSASSIYASPNSGSSNTVWYYFGSTGRMYINEWVESNGKWYALSPNGTMYAEAVVNNDLVNWDDDNNYYMNKSGEMVTGWYKTTDKTAGSYAKASESDIVIKKNFWVYGNPSSGVLAEEEWQNIEGKWYYFGVDARTSSNGVKDDNLHVLLAKFGANSNDLAVDDIEMASGTKENVAVTSKIASGSSVTTLPKLNTEYADAREGEYISKYSDSKANNATRRHAMLEDQIIAWYNHENKLKYFCLEDEKGAAITDWYEIDDDYYIAGNNKGELYNDTIAKINGKYYYFNSDGICNYKNLNNSYDYAVVIADDYNANETIGNGKVIFYETTDRKASNYVDLSTIKTTLKENNYTSVRFGTRTVKIDSLTAAEAVLAYAAYDNDASGEEMSIFKLRNSSAIEEKKVELIK